MTPTKKQIMKEPSVDPLPPKIIGLLRESTSLALLSMMLYLILIFYGYDRADSGWSHNVGSALVQNPGGYVGAWLSDLLLYLFGVSAWLWVLLCLCLVLWSYRRLNASGGVFNRRSLFVSAAGFITLLAASSGLEALRFYTLGVTLPQTPGGMLGNTISKNLSQALGFTGSTLALLALITISLSLFTGLSWLRFVEKLGELIENSYSSIQGYWQDRQDRQAGIISLVKREELVETEKKRLEDYPPLHITLPVGEILKSPRVIHLCLLCISWMKQKKM